MKNVDAERSVLAAIVAGTELTLHQVLDTGLRPEDFSQSSFGLAFARVLAMEVDSMPIDSVTLAAELHKHGEKVDLVEILNQPAPPDHGEAYARLVGEAAVCRRLRNAGSKLIEIAEGSGNVSDVRAAAEEALTEAVRPLSTRDQARSITEDSESLLAEIREAYRTKTPITGASTGFRSLDEALGGLWPGQLITIAAGTGNGKSTLAQNIAENFAERGEPVLYVSLEMSRRELLLRAFARKSRVSSRIIESGQFASPDQLERFAAAIPWVKENLTRLKIQDDGTSMSLAALRAEANALKRDGLGLIVIDYIQLMNGNGTERSRSEQIATITRSLKLLATRMQVPVLALSQFNREGSRSERPRLYHLKESSSIEQDSDVVMFIHDPSDHDPDKTADGTVEILIDKNRRGGTAEVKLAFARTFSTFGEMGVSNE